MINKEDSSKSVRFLLSAFQETDSPFFGVRLSVFVSNQCPKSVRLGISDGHSLSFRRVSSCLSNFDNRTRRVMNKQSLGLATTQKGD